MAIWSRKEKELNQAQKNKKAIKQLTVAAVVGFMIAVSIVYVAVGAVTNSGLFIPKSANQVLGSVDESDHYSWTVETLRKVKLGNTDTEQASFRSAVVDTKLNHFQALTVGNLPDKTVFTSDGRVTLYLNQTLQSTGGSGWRLATNYCEKEPAFSADDLTWPSVKMFKAAKPDIQTDQSTVYGERSWVLGFEPNREIMDKLMWLSFFSKATANQEEAGNWVLSKSEKEAFLSGKYKVTQAQVWVTRDKPRQTVQILVDVQTQADPGSTWRIFARKAPTQSTERELKTLSTGNIDCSVSGQEQTATPNTETPDLGTITDGIGQDPNEAPTDTPTGTTPETPAPTTPSETPAEAPTDGTTSEESNDNSDAPNSDSGAIGVD